MNSNPHDPLMKFGPEADKALFRTFSEASNGYPIASALNAAVNILINAVRQQHPTRLEAERAFDELIGCSKAMLLERHYDSAGRRKGIFPYEQLISLEHVNFRGKISQ